jgi:hypothetical protein
VVSADWVQAAAPWAKEGRPALDEACERTAWALTAWGLAPGAEDEPPGSKVRIDS